MQCLPPPKAWTTKHATYLTKRQMDTSVKGAENHFIRTFPKQMVLKPPSANFDPAPRNIPPPPPSNNHATASSASLFIPRAPARSASHHTSYASSPTNVPAPISTSGSGWGSGAARSPTTTTPTTSYFQGSAPKATPSALSTIHTSSPVSWQPKASAASPTTTTSFSSNIGLAPTSAATRAFRPTNALPISRAEYDDMPEMDRYMVARYLHTSQNNPAGLKAAHLWRPTWSEEDEARLWDAYLADEALRDAVRTLVESKLSRDPRKR